MTSIVFPGQGSQTAGMVRDFYDNFETAKLIFEEIEDYTKIDLKKIIFENSEDKLNLTKYTQISIFAASYTIFVKSSLASHVSLRPIKGARTLGHCFIFRT